MQRDWPLVVLVGMILAAYGAQLVSAGKEGDWAAFWIMLVIGLIGLAPLWLWGLDNLFHFGYAGD
jgi:hypothetical protein